VRLLVYSMLFPNARAPHHGVFVRERLWRYRERHGGQLAVVAPVPRWRRAFAGVREREDDGDVPVRHPRFTSLPGPLDLLRAALMAAGSRAALLDEGRRLQPDVLDAHYAWPDGVAAARLVDGLSAALGRRVPLVVTARGTDLNLSARSPRVARELRAGLARADHVVCVAEALRREALSLGLPPDRISTLRNGVDGRRFTPGDRAAARAVTGLPAGRPVLLCVGHLVARKGQHLLLPALAAAHAAGRRPLLVLVGDGPDAAALRAQAGRLGLTDDVRFAGVVPPARLPDWYRAADALVLPSLREGWPNVVLEALACGTPVLATAVWGTPEILTGCRAGLLVPPTTEGLRDGLLRLSGLDAAAARPWAEAHSWDATLDGLQRVYESVTGRAAR
jgi:glycosyltransferase involved in cell wall biosynthesis